MCCALRAQETPQGDRVEMTKAGKQKKAKTYLLSRLLTGAPSSPRVGNPHPMSNTPAQFSIQVLRANGLQAKGAFVV
jgi:hypothetical protein